MRADTVDTRPYFIVAIIINDLLSAAPRFSMPRNLFRLLAPPSAHTTYDQRTRAGVINYWHQGAGRATSVPPDHPQQHNEENPSRTARAYDMIPVDICAKQTDLLEKCVKWYQNRYKGQVLQVGKNAVS